jgi:hypothetical protein
MTQQLAKTNQGGALATKGLNPRYENEDEEDVMLPRVHLYQGLPAEAKQYGKGFEAGDLINTLSNDKIVGRKFVPIYAYNQWIVWKEPRGAGIELSTRNKSEVAPEDLDWDREAGTPPRAQKYMNFVVLFEGETSPVVLSFTKTGINAGKSLNTLEKMRTGRGPGLYGFETKERSNDKGAWLAPNVRPLGDPDPAMKETAEAIFTSMNPAAIKTNLEESSSDDVDPDQM